MPYVETISRNQLKILSLDMMVDQKSIARVIDTFVNSLNMEELGFTRAKSAIEGRPAYPPQELLKLYIYGHRYSIRSSRKLAYACCVNLEVIWLTGGLQPDFRTISDFRKDNVEVLKKVFLEFNKRFLDLLIGYQSVDGTKIFANNSKDKNFTGSKLDDRISWLKNHIEEYMRQLEQSDDEEELTGKFTAKELNEKIAEAKERLEKYEKYRTFMEENNLSQMSLTDEDARLMKVRNGFAVAHNVETSVDSETHMITNYNVISNGTDYGQMEATLLDIKKAIPDKILESTADKGYESEEDMAGCLLNGIVPHVIPPEGQDTYELTVPYEPEENLDPESKKSEEIKKCLQSGVIPEAYKDYIESAEVKEEYKIIRPEGFTSLSSPFANEEEMRNKAIEGYFVRDPERNIVLCPAGETLRQNYVTKQDKIRYINKLACRNCPVKINCCAAMKGFKEVDFYKDEFVKPNGKWLKAKGEKPKFKIRSFKKELRKVVKLIFRPDKHKMAQRMCLSEHPFGTIKRSQGGSYFLLRGNKKVTGEFSLFALAYNLQRIINKLGFDKVMERVTI